MSSSPEPPPNNWLAVALTPAFDHLVFLDAVDVGAAPGSVVFLNSQEMAARFPQISTHNISLGLLAKYVESGGTFARLAPGRATGLLATFARAFTRLSKRPWPS